MVAAWYMDDSAEDQRKPHQLSPNKEVSLKELADLGVLYWRMNAEIAPEQDEALTKIRKDRGYTYTDTIRISPDSLPNYDAKLKIFFEEHLHTDEEIRYILEGTGYFDVRDKDDKWIRISMGAGDLITLPAGIYHRFTLDEANYLKAMRLFVGEPVWTPYNRVAEGSDGFVDAASAARKSYLENFVAKLKA